MDQKDRTDSVMVARQTWHRPLADAEIPGWVTALGTVDGVQTLKTENGCTTITLYRVVLPSGAYRTVMAAGPATLTSRDLGVLASMLLAEGFSPDSKAYERFVEAPPSDEAAKKKAEAACAAAAESPSFKGLGGPLEFSIEGFLSGADPIRMFRLRQPDLDPKDAEWLAKHRGQVVFGDGPDFVVLTADSLCGRQQGFIGQQMGLFTVKAPDLHGAVEKGKQVIALLAKT